MRTGAIELIEAARAGALFDAPPDVIFVTSLTSAADVRAMLPRGMRDVPIVLYMHENQAAYPISDDGGTTAEWDVQYALTNLTSIMSADRTIWNSAWNLRSFVAEIESILRHHPDPSLPDLTARIADGTVVWPPVEPPPAPEAVGEGSGEWGRREGRPIHVLWPHRAEHDKGPDELLEIARACARTHDLRWILLGERYRETPPALKTFRREFADTIEHDAFEPDRQRYWAHLARADWVLSTARHEFFGIAVAEALLAGCLPWLPDRLSYPEIVPRGAHGLSPMCPPDDPDAVRAAVRAHLEPVLAPNAVGRIEDVIEEVLQSDRRLA